MLILIGLLQAFVGYSAFVTGYIHMSCTCKNKMKIHTLPIAVNVQAKSITSGDSSEFLGMSTE